MSKVRTRFAPSPTGFLHVGGIRTALFNYLYAKQNDGQFILRLEDTDRERFVAEGVEQIVEALDWLDLKPDEGFWISEGQHRRVDYVQSERHKAGFYKKYAEELVEKGLAYRDWTSQDQLFDLREKARQTKRPFIFRKSMAKLDGDITKPHVIRFDVIAQQKNSKKLQSGKLFVEWKEIVRGSLHVRYKDIDDFILIKSDSFPTYNFASVIDDHDMAITHVLRGEEFIPSTPKHLLLYDAFGWQPPAFVHLPVINGTDGKKLSKRTGDTNVLDYRDKGYLPEALINFLALLGWNDGTEQEIFSKNELINKFRLEQINNSPAVFDPKRLDWMNGYYIRQMKLHDLYKLAKPYFPQESNLYDNQYKLLVLGLVQERIKYFAELPDLTRFFFTDLPVNPKLINEHKQLKKLSKRELKDLLEQSKQALQQSNFTSEDLMKRLNKLLRETGQKPVVLFSLIRIATTQAPASPELAPTLAVLGKEKTLKRIQKQLAELN